MKKTDLLNNISNTIDWLAQFENIVKTSMFEENDKNNDTQHSIPKESLKTVIPRAAVYTDNDGKVLYEQTKLGLGDLYIKKTDRQFIYNICSESTNSKIFCSTGDLKELILQMKEGRSDGLWVINMNSKKLTKIRIDNDGECFCYWK